MIEGTLINLTYGKDFITYDLRLKQIRYLKDYKNLGEIFFINCYHDLEGIEYLNKPLIKKCIFEELEEEGFKLDLKKMRFKGLKIKKEGLK